MIGASNDLSERPRTGAVLARTVARMRDVTVTLVEGIETPEQLVKLCALGCDLARGYLMARPLTGPDLRRLLLSAPPW